MSCTYSALRALSFSARRSSTLAPANAAGGSERAVRRAAVLETCAVSLHQRVPQDARDRAADLLRQYRHDQRLEHRRRLRHVQPAGSAARAAQAHRVGQREPVERREVLLDAQQPADTSARSPARPPPRCRNRKPARSTPARQHPRSKQRPPAQGARPRSSTLRKCPSQYTSAPYRSRLKVMCDAVRAWS